MKRKYCILSVCFLAAFFSAVMFSGCGSQEEKPGTSIESRVDSALDNSTDVADVGGVIDTSSVAVPGDTTATLSEKAKAGEKIFLNTSLGKVKVSCVMCHSKSGSAPRGKVGHSLAGVTKRSSTWNGMYKGADLQKSAYGASLCAVLFQMKDGGLTAEETASLNEYLASLETVKGAVTSPLAIKWAAKPSLKKGEFVDDKIAEPVTKAILKLPGDPDAGKIVFDRSCAMCHNMKSQKIGPAVADAAGDAGYVVSVVRFGMNAMPFFAKDVLTDQQVADVVAYIQLSAGQ